MGFVVGRSTEVVASKVVHPSKGLTSGRFPWIIQWGNTVEKYRGSRTRKHLWVYAKPPFPRVIFKQRLWSDVLVRMARGLVNAFELTFNRIHIFQTIIWRRLIIIKFQIAKESISASCWPNIWIIIILLVKVLAIIKIKISSVRTMINSSSSISASEDIGSCLSSFNQWSVIPWKNLVMLSFWYRFFNNFIYIYKWKLANYTSIQILKH